MLTASSVDNGCGASKSSRAFTLAASSSKNGSAPSMPISDALRCAMSAWAAVLGVPRAAQYIDKAGLLRDRPVYVAVAAGGILSGERARQPDFLTPHLRAVLASIGLRDVRFFAVEGTALGAQVAARGLAVADGALRAHFDGPPGGSDPVASGATVA